MLPVSVNRIDPQQKYYPYRRKRETRFPIVCGEPLRAHPCPKVDSLATLGPGGVMWKQTDVHTRQDFSVSEQRRVGVFP